MNVKSLNEKAKLLWGASHFPFADGSKTPYRSERFSQVLENLQNWLSLHGSGLIHGDNGVGKSYLVGALLGELNEKEYLPLLNTHSTLRGPGLIRILTRQLGSEPSLRREDNIAQIHQRFQEQHPRWPVLIFDESQNLSTEALEEIRLLNCHQKGSRASFSTLFVGDHNLMPRLLLGVNQPLLSRISFSLEVASFDPAESRQYIDHRLEEAAIHRNPFEPPAMNTLIESSSGHARTINTLARAALQKACQQEQSEVTQQQMQQVVESIPWLRTLRAPMN